MTGSCRKSLFVASRHGLASASRWGFPEVGVFSQEFSVGAVAKPSGLTGCNTRALEHVWPAHPLCVSQRFSVTPSLGESARQTHQPAWTALFQPSQHEASAVEATGSLPRGASLHTTRGLRSVPKKLQVVLNTRMEGIGNPGDVVRVSPGYARNFLIPYQLAYPALPKFIRAVKEAREKAAASAPEEEMAEADAASAAAAPPVIAEITQDDMAREAAEVAERLDTCKLSIRRIVPRRSTQCRQPVTSDDIIAEVARQQGIHLSPKNVQLQAPLGNVGTFDVPLVFPGDVELPGGKEQIYLKVNVRRK